MSRSQRSFEQLLEHQIQTLALTLQPSTVRNYRSVSHRFLTYLRTAFPNVRRISQLRRDPHMLGWLRWLCEQDPPLYKSTRTDHLICLRRLLDDLAIQGHPVQPGLIIGADFPARQEYLPRALSPGDDHLLQEQLRPHRQSVFQCSLADASHRNSRW